jgi:hypothetical protein
LSHQQAYAGSRCDRQYGEELGAEISDPSMTPTDLLVLGQEDLLAIAAQLSYERLA